MRISDCSSDVCSSDLVILDGFEHVARLFQQGLALVDQHAGRDDLLAAFAVHASALTSPLSIWKPAPASSSQRARCRSSRLPLVATSLHRPPWKANIGRASWRGRTWQ